MHLSSRKSWFLLLLLWTLSLACGLLFISSSTSATAAQGRTVKSATTKASLQDFHQQHCLNLRSMHDKLLDPLLQYWNESGFDQQLLESTSDQRVYIYQGTIYLSETTGWARTIPTFVKYLQHIASLVNLPNMMLPLNPADEPLAAVKEGEMPRPLLAFCKVPGYSDVLIPNTAEGDVHPQPAGAGIYRKGLTSGPQDARKAAVIWRGTTGGFEGLRKGRHIVLQLGVEQPDLVNSGVSDWDESKYGPHKGKLKPFVPIPEQIRRYKYQVWLPGNCASIRLASQLAADAAVFKVQHDDMEWYYPLLKPYVHYIPVTANETHTDLLDQVRWAEGHKDSVRAIVIAANAFARQYLTATARDCYFVQLSLRYHQLTHWNFTQPQHVILPPT